MLKTKDIKINANQIATNIYVSFEDPEIHIDQYVFLKDRFKTYHLYFNKEYNFKTETEYKESSQILLVGINITIPEQLIPKDSYKAYETIMEPVDLFQKFYEAQNHIYQRKFCI